MASMQATAALGATVALCLSALAPSANAQTPAEKARAAIERTGQATTARIAVTHRFVAPDRALEQRVEGALARGDHDLTTQGEGGRGRRVAVGTETYERRPDQSGTGWRQSSRPAPTTANAFGRLTLADGTSLGDPKLFRSPRSPSPAAGASVATAQSSERIELELDMAAVARAMRLPAADARRLEAMTGSLVLWIGADGRVIRNMLRLELPPGAGGGTLETTIDLADLDAPITITRPSAP